MEYTSQASIPSSMNMENQSNTADQTPSELVAKDSNVNTLTNALGELTLEEQEDMKKDWVEEMSELDKMFFEHAREKFTSIPQVEMPTELLRGIKLFPHQEQGVRWMVSQELSNDPPGFWVRAGKDDAPKWKCKVGGFKWRASPPDSIRGGVLADDMGLGKTIQTMTLFCANRPNTNNPRCTLIVAPVSVMGSWNQHVKQYTKPGIFKTHVVEDNKYAHLSKLIKNNKVDIVIISYARLVSIMNKHEEFFENSFHRVVLDEAHNIRNSDSKNFKAAFKVQAKHKWALTGSPFVNSPDDIASLLAFLRVEPLCHKDEFKEKVVKPIRDKKVIGLTRLRNIVAHVFLRRAKAHVDTKIPKKTAIVHGVKFEHCSIHQNLYDDVYEDARELVIENARADEGMKESMLGKVLRVRQACCDVRLLPHEIRGDQVGSSPKIAALLELIREMATQEKGLIFSEWTTFLDLIGDALDSSGHSFTRIDGSMSASDREEAIENFNEDDGPRFILCSLKSAGVGITLTRGNCVFIMSPWWNESEESQAMDRCHRIEGQLREVRVYRLVMEDSVEERMLRLQEAKATMGKGTFTKLKKKDLAKAKLTAMRDLFQVDDAAVQQWDAMHLADDDSDDDF